MLDRFKIISPIKLTFFLAVYFFCFLNFSLVNKLVGIIGALDHVSLPFIITIPVFFIAALTFIRRHLFSGPSQNHF
jgi:lipid A ethanolaminephosphotransferase